MDSGYLLGALIITAVVYDLGILGGGQLGRMSIMAAQRMGLKCLSLDPDAESPAAQIGPSLVGALNDPSKIASVISSCGRVTLENEFIEADAIRKACRIAGASETVLMPGLDCLATIQDKLNQREALARLNVPAPRASALGSIVDAEALGFPVVIKARFGGYDGRGTRYAKDVQDLEALRGEWGSGGWLVEEFVPFRRELAVMAYVGERGSGSFPTMETVQRDHVCDLVYPCDADGSAIAMRAVESVGGVGLFGVELFQLDDGRLLVNEIAPRPHNTGHYSLDWGGVSQFEQHVRLALGLPLAPPKGEPTCMANLLGQVDTGEYRAALAAALEEPGARVHWYGKKESRPGRKMGHINVAGKGDILAAAKRARELFYGAWTAR